MEVQSLSRGNFTILDAVEAIRSDYSVELAKIYADLIVKKEITPVESHDVIMTVASGKSKTKTLTVGQLNELKDKLPNISINEISGKYGYQTTEELLDNIKIVIIVQQIGYYVKLAFLVILLNTMKLLLI